MGFLMGKAEFIFLMDAIFRDGSIKAKPQDRIISIYTQMALSIEDLLHTLRKMGSENSFFTIDFNTQVFGWMESPMVMMGYKFILMAVNILVALQMDSSKAKASIFGPMEKFILANLKMDIWMVREL